MTLNGHLSLNSIGSMSVDDLVQLYNRVMTDVLDKHCPVVTVRHLLQFSRRRRGSTPTAVPLVAEQEQPRDVTDVRAVTGTSVRGLTRWGSWVRCTKRRTTTTGGTRLLLETATWRDCGDFFTEFWVTSPVMTPTHFPLTTLPHSSVIRSTLSVRPLLLRRFTTSRTGRRRCLMSRLPWRTDEIEKLISSALCKTSVGPGSNMAGEGHTRSVVAFHLASVQQVTWRLAASPPSSRRLWFVHC